MLNHDIHCSCKSLKPWAVFHVELQKQWVSVTKSNIKYKYSVFENSIESIQKYIVLRENVIKNLIFSMQPFCWFQSIAHQVSCTDKVLHNFYKLWGLKLIIEINKLRFHSKFTLEKQRVKQNNKQSKTKQTKRMRFPVRQFPLFFL